MLDGIVPPALVVSAALVLLGIRRFLASRPSGVPATVAVGTGVVIVTAFLELAMGRSPTYRHGPLRLWVSDVNSDQNSQQLADAYTFSHLIHGALFYGITYVTMRRASFAKNTADRRPHPRSCVGGGNENTDTVINRYRAATIALGYYGDSVLNSVRGHRRLSARLRARQPPALVVDGVVGGRDGGPAGDRHPRQPDAQYGDADLAYRGNQALADGRMRCEVPTSALRVQGSEFQVRGSRVPRSIDRTRNTRTSKLETGTRNSELGTKVAY